MTTFNIIFGAATLLVNAAEVFQFTHAWRIQFSNEFWAYVFVFVCLAYPFTIPHMPPIHTSSHIIDQIHSSVFMHAMLIAYSIAHIYAIL